MEIIYTTANGQLGQSDRLHSYFLTFGGITYKMAPCSLIALKTKLQQYNIEQLLLDPQAADLEIIPLCNRNHFLVLSLVEMIELKELLNGTFAMLELNSIVNSIA